jgi:molybdopterin-guanine dinucleotide biosynthesis protein A
MAALPRNILALLLLVAACLPLAAHAQTHVQVQTWDTLNIHQKEALGPLSSTWNSLSEKQHKNFLSIAENYPKLTPQKQQRLHEQMEKWSKLTPEQRNRAREKYKAFNKVPAEQREAVKKMVREQQASRAASSVPPVPASH